MPVWTGGQYVHGAAVVVPLFARREAPMPSPEGKVDRRRRDG